MCCRLFSFPSGASFSILSLESHASVAVFSLSPVAHPSQSFLSHRHMLYLLFSCGTSFSILSLSQTRIILLFLLWHILLNLFSLTDTYYICSFSCGTSFSILSLSQTHIIFALTPVAYPSQSFLTHRHILYLLFLLWHILLNPFSLTDTYYICSFSCGTSFPILSLSKTHIIFALSPVAHPSQSFLSHRHIIYCSSPEAHPSQSFLSHRHILYLLSLLWHILFNPFFLTDTYYICSFSCGISFAILSLSQKHIIFAMTSLSFSVVFLAHLFLFALHLCSFAWLFQKHPLTFLSHSPVLLCMHIRE